MHDFFGEATALAEFRGALTQFLVKSNERGIVLVGRLHFVDRHDDGAEISLGNGVLKRSRALLALKQELHATKPALNLSNASDHSHRIKNVGSGLVCIVSLCNREHEALAFQSGFDGAKRTGSAGRDRGGQARKNHRPP